MPSFFFQSLSADLFDMQWPTRTANVDVAHDAPIGRVRTTSLNIDRSCQGIFRSFTLVTVFALAFARHRASIALRHPNVSMHRNSKWRTQAVFEFIKNSWYFQRVLVS